ncbi:MAG: hypothetical protein WBN35_05510, partial [Acidimicrobiia bacterium]
MTSGTQTRDQSAYFPTDQEYDGLLKKRTRRALAVQGALMLALTVAVIALITLLLTIINDSFGLVAQVNQVEPEEIVASAGYDPAEVALGDLSKDELVTVLGAGISNNVGRRLERDQRFYEDRLVFETQAKWDEVCASSEPPAGCTG